MYKAPSCEHFGRYFSYLSWCENCKDFTSHRGLKRNSFCYRCIMVKNCNTAIQNGTHSCQNPETSLTNKEIHRKTISSQIKNGTFNMMNPKIHEKATKNKMKNYSSGYCNCNKCGKKNVILNSFGICSECQSKIAMEIVKDKFCKKCNKITPHNGKVCCICHPDSDVINRPNFITKNNVRYYKDKELNQLCEDLLSGKEDINNYPGFEIRLGRICYNRKDVLNDEIILLNQNFQIKDGVKFYKNVPVKEIIQKLDSKEYNIDNFPGWNKRFGEWYYNLENILTGDIDRLNRSLFHQKDKELWYYDSSIKDYIVWSEFKNKFKIKSNNIDLPKDFKLYPTFRVQSSDDWGGANNAFEQSLVDDDIQWFIYLKFYLDNDSNSIPLVCGKSGSLLVNSRGSDVNFSTNIDDGPARRFLLEENLQWDKTKVAILKCASEQDAYDKEKYYLKKLNLFGS